SGRRATESTQSPGASSSTSAPTRRMKPCAASAARILAATGAKASSLMPLAPMPTARLDPPLAFGQVRSRRVHASYAPNDRQHRGGKVGWGCWLAGGRADDGG